MQHPASFLHVAEHPSPLIVLLSSHSSPDSTMPLPHTGHGPTVAEGCKAQQTGSAKWVKLTPGCTTQHGCVTLQNPTPGKNVPESSVHEKSDLTPQSGVFASPSTLQHFAFNVHVLEHPSLFSEFPSSHSSGDSKIPFPQKPQLTFWHGTPCVKVVRSTSFRLHAETLRSLQFVPLKTLKHSARVGSERVSFVTHWKQQALSMKHCEVHPSPSTLLPSSHSSGDVTAPSPHSHTEESPWNTEPGKLAHRLQSHTVHTGRFVWGSV